MIIRSLIQWIVFTAFLSLAGVNAYGARAKATQRNSIQTIFSDNRWRVIAAETESDATSKGAANLIVLQRFVRVEKVAFPVATLTQSVIKRNGTAPTDFAEAEAEAAKIAETLRAAVDGPKWTMESRKDAGLVIFRAEWLKQNRFVQLVYRNLGDSFALSNSSTRRMYAFPIAIEANYLQQTVALALNSTTKKSAQHGGLRELIAALIGPEAFAQVSPGSSASVFRFSIDGKTYSGTVPPGFSPADVRTYLTQLMKTGTADFNSIVTTTGGTVTRTGQQLAATGTQFIDGATGRFNGVVDRTLNSATAAGNTLVKRTLDSAASTVNGVTDHAGFVANGVLDHAHAQALDVERRTITDANAAIKSATSNQNLIRIAAVTATTAAVAGGVAGAATSLAINALVDGTAYVVSGLYHSIMGTLTDAEKEAMSRGAGAAFAQIDASLQKLADLEKRLDMSNQALATVYGMPPEQIAEGLSRAIERNSAYLDRARGKMRSARNPAEENLCLDQIEGQKRLQNQLTATYEILAANRGSPLEVCTKMAEMLRQWASVESSLHNARIQLLNNQTAVLREISKGFVDSHQQVASIRRSTNDCDSSRGDLEKMRSDASANRNCVSAQYGSAQYNPSRSDKSYEADVNQRCTALGQVAMRRLIDRMSQACSDARGVYFGRDLTTENQNGMYLAANSMANAQRTLREVAAVDCEAGNVSGNCSGQAGAFRQIQNHYLNLVAKARVACPGMDIMPVEGDPVLVQLPAGAIGAVPLASSGEAYERRSWVGRQFSTVGNFFSSLF